MNIEQRYERCLEAYKSFQKKLSKWDWNISEKHNYLLSSINSLLEKKNHCIKIVSLFNETITYVN